VAEKVIILGAGESGMGAALLAKRQGYDVLVSDAGKIHRDTKKALENMSVEWEENTHSLERMESAEWIIKSPGIPEDVEVIRELRKKKARIVSEIEFASKFTNATLIGVTGSNGKTTTVLMIYEILKNAGLHVGLAGNIGNSFAREVAENNYSYYVLEISSFQLDDIIDFAPEFAVITNITPDHLDRYENDFSQYVNSKLRITENQKEKDFLLFNSDDPILRNALSKENLTKAVLHPYGTTANQNKTYIKENVMILQNSNTNTMIDTLGFNLTGRHNLLNAMAAATVADLLKISKEEIRKSLTHFKGVPHRLESVLTIQKAHYVNDSKATNVNATFFALESMPGEVVWIAGGVDKGNDYMELMPLVREKVKALICLGLDNEKLVATFGNVCDIVVETQSMSEAVKIAYKVAEKNDTVLLSPACASFDLFKNYTERGDAFKKAVRNL